MEKRFYIGDKVEIAGYALRERGEKGIITGSRFGGVQFLVDFDGGGSDWFLGSDLFLIKRNQERA